MTFQPVVPFSGVAGWSFLQRTRDLQQQVFEGSARLTRNVDHFRDKIAGITSAEDLVKDRRLLEVALGAFGLDEDINNKYFIERILTSSTTDTGSLANRLSDKRYLAMAKAFGFGDVLGPRNGYVDFDEQIVSAYRDRQFEIALGDTAPAMRMALGLERDLGDIAKRQMSDNAKWFTVMATSPVRAVFEGALGMPASVGALDLDRQLIEFRTRAERFFGISEVSDFNTPEMREKLISRYLTQDQLTNGSTGMSPQSAALAILQSGQTFG